MKSVIVPSVQSPPSMLKLHDFCNRAGFCTPSDPSDLGRCLRLLELVPEWKARISEMAIHGREWAALVSHWEELHQLMDDEVGIDWSKGNSALRTYERMKAIQGHHRT
ncbi:hypothetical protein [Pseudomonas aeruginosa]|uniref:hypothetical protein n=1 Tax=Pseudomonas aeruginosa TaxID=287 RepID=UPI0027D944EA